MSSPHELNMSPQDGGLSPPTECVDEEQVNIRPGGRDPGSQPGPAMNKLEISLSRHFQVCKMGIKKKKSLLQRSQ